MPSTRPHHIDASADAPSWPRIQLQGHGAGTSRSEIFAWKGGAGRGAATVIRLDHRRPVPRPSTAPSAVLTGVPFREDALVQLAESRNVRVPIEQAPRLFELAPPELRVLRRQQRAQVTAFRPEGVLGDGVQVAGPLRARDEAIGRNAVYRGQLE